MAFQITYGGVPLLVPTPDLEAYVEHWMSVQELRDIVPPANLPPWNLASITFARQPDEPPRKLNQYYYPTGASRWSVVRCLATTDMLTDIYNTYPDGYSPQSVLQFQMQVTEMIPGAAVTPPGGGSGTPGTLQNPSVQTVQNPSAIVSTPLAMLPPRRISPDTSQAGTPIQGLWLITLVDERYWWQFIEYNFANINYTWTPNQQGLPFPTGFTPNTLGWGDFLFGLLGGSGLTVNGDPNWIQTLNNQTKVYGFPDVDSDFFQNLSTIPHAIDAACANIGRGFVRNLDGSLQIQKYSDGNTVASQNRPLNAPVATAGGTLDVADTLGNSVVENMAPTVVSVYFPVFFNGRYQDITAAQASGEAIDDGHLTMRGWDYYRKWYGCTVFLGTVAGTNPGMPIQTANGPGGPNFYMRDTCKAVLMQGNYPYGPWGFSADPSTQQTDGTGDPSAFFSNGAQLSQLVVQLGADITDSTQAFLDETYPGMYPWVPECNHDVTWTYRKSGPTTRVQKRPWNWAVFDFAHSFSPALFRDGRRMRLVFLLDDISSANAVPGTTNTIAVGGSEVVINTYPAVLCNDLGGPDLVSTTTLQSYTDVNGNQFMYNCLAQNPINPPSVGSGSTFAPNGVQPLPGTPPGSAGFVGGPSFNPRKFCYYWALESLAQNTFGIIGPTGSQYPLGIKLYEILPGPGLKGSAFPGDAFFPPVNQNQSVDQNSMINYIWHFERLDFDPNDFIFNGGNVVQDANGNWQSQSGIGFLSTRGLTQTITSCCGDQWTFQNGLLQGFAPGNNGLPANPPPGGGNNPPVVNPPPQPPQPPVGGPANPPGGIGIAPLPGLPLLPGIGIAPLPPGLPLFPGIRVVPFPPGVAPLPGIRIAPPVFGAGGVAANPAAIPPANLPVINVTLPGIQVFSAVNATPLPAQSKPFVAVATSVSPSTIQLAGAGSVAPLEALRSPPPVFKPTKPKKTNLPPAASNVHGSRTFSSNGTFTWVAPDGVTHVQVEVWGSGANGTPSAAGPGGGGGAYGRKNFYAVIPGHSYTVIVDAAGAGLTSSFGGSVNASSGSGSTGGINGINVDVVHTGGNGGLGGGGVGGGGGGSGGTAANGNNGTAGSLGGAGGAAVSGGGAGGNGSSGAGGNGTSPGGGGGSGSSQGNGADGQVVLTW